MSETFGARFNTAADAGERLALEQAEGRRGELAKLDHVLDALIVRALSGQRVFGYDDERGDYVDLSVDDLAVLAEHLNVASQESKGAWYLPEEGSVSIGAVEAARAGRTDPRLMMSFVDRRGMSKLLAQDPAWFAAWAVLEPFFDVLVRPLELRGPLAGKYDAMRLAKEWAAIDAFHAALGMDLAEQLGTLRPRGGWTTLNADGKTLVRAELVHAWTEWATPENVGCVRTWAIGQLTEAYYRKAKGTGRAIARKVLTKPLQRVLSGYFAGDWLAFLAYLGEEPHASEEIITALPEPKLFVARANAGEVAEQEGVPASEVEKILAAFYADEQSASPVLRRVDALKEYWQAFDSLHAAQTDSAETLWGLIEEGGNYLDPWEGPFIPGAAQKRLPPEIQELVLRWWGTSVHTRAPLKLVSQTDPWGMLTQTFGPALRFWQEAGLVAFAQTEARGYARHSLKQLTQNERPEARKFGVSPEFFRELEAAEALLPPEPEPDDTSTRYPVEIDGHPALSFELSITVGSGRGPRKRRGGWPILNEIVTRHRRQWAQEHLDGYLRERWETDVRQAAETYNRLLLSKGKEPTARQVVVETREALDRWFGGDVDQLHRALGQRSPGEVSTAGLIMPADRRAFSLALRRELGAIRPPMFGPADGDPQVRHDQDQRWRGITRIAEDGPKYVQLWEALGQRPERKQFPLTGYSEMYLDPNPERALELFAAAVDRALANPTGGAVREYESPGQRAERAVEQTVEEPDMAADEPVREHRGFLGRFRGR